MAVSFSRSAIVTDVLLFIILIFLAIYLGVFRNSVRLEIIYLVGENYYYLTWVASGGYVLLTSQLLVSSFMDGDSTRRSWLAICSSFVGGVMFLTLAIVSTMHVGQLNQTVSSIVFSNSEKNGYKFIMGTNYLLAILFWLDCAIRFVVRKRDGTGKETD